MKKIFILIILCITSFYAYAQKDTTLVTTPCVFTTQTTTTDKGTLKTEYYVTTLGEKYVSTATSYKRYKALKRFGASPNYAMITDRKSKAKKIIIL